MKNFFKFILLLLVLLIAFVGIYYVVNNEKLPEGKQGVEADALATKMLSAINNEAFKNTEVIEWSFRGVHNYKWYKQQERVSVSWDNNWVELFFKNPDKNKVFIDGKEVNNPALIKTATDFFNNDSFWLVAPHKVFDNGVERSLVKHNDKDALMVTYTSGGTTPGDSYLWILDENGFPTDYKMWTKIIPIGGVSATWSDWKTTEAGFKLPTKHTLSLFGMELNMGEVKASNPNADNLTNEILKAINHEAYKKTNTIEWSFAGRRNYKWDKKNHIVEVSWDTTKVILHPNNLEKSAVFFNDKNSSSKNTETIKKAESLFNNDSFWLVAPHKLFEDGIIRTTENIDNKQALRVTYTTGGSTPGDSYVWLLDENNVPKSYLMYLKSRVQKGNTEGMPATWEDWITTESGALLPTNHSFGNGGKLSMGTVKGYN
ncbi:hypothetical protein [Tenacibaculum sp. 1_MG-2023]|uniref:hypothetical protein n=1 Tax=Tenacibaculum sp. 1_MG-2023 TaxID=3062653 RepID=UPI0026E306E0|nr:hypothetical protein [Tenacibaculum sp. 1_MG-2023]MDO6600612.1 hypothetical protein [Tenacibaculum sp. 1_MG-2023]